MIIIFVLFAVFCDQYFYAFLANYLIISEYIVSKFTVQFINKNNLLRHNKII